MTSYPRPTSQGYYAPSAAAGGGSSSGSGVDANIDTLAELAAIPTINLTPPVIKVWVLEADGTTQTWRLLASTAATADGVQRPDDYASPGNAKVWFKAAN